MSFIPTTTFPANSGGSYIKGADGVRTLVVPPTGERPCKCRDEHPPVPAVTTATAVLDFAEAEELEQDPQLDAEE
jgi:hypothetical protein